MKTFNSNNMSLARPEPQAHVEKYIYLAVMVLVLAFLISGCSWLRGHGKLRLQSGPGQRVTIEELRDNWDKYTVYYTGLSFDNPSAIMFDPKEDGKSLVSDEWIKVEDQQALSGLISSIQNSPRFYPKLQRILGPDNQFYGYFFSAWDHVLIKVVDDRTLWVDDLPMPRFLYDPGYERAEPAQE